MTTHPHISAWLSTALWPLPARAPSLSTHNHGARHYIDLGIGEVSLAATTAPAGGDWVKRGSTSP